MEKYIKDGKVAILVSPEYGAGWSTWNIDCPEMLYDPTIVDILLNNDDMETVIEKVKSVCTLKYPDAYMGGLEDLHVVWLDVGTEFIIEEFDGAESLRIKNEIDWMVA